MLLLFDIDGTLTIGGPGKTAFRIALEHIYGTSGPIVNHDFSGKTDPLLLRELLGAAGRTPHEIEAGRGRFWKVYLAELESHLATDPVTVLPGVPELIGTLVERSDVFLGLVTGNVRAGAQLKLQSVGLWRHFPTGAFGCDHEVRNELPPIALERAGSRWSRTFRGADTVVIGDTPRDVACGKAVGAATVAVTTGRFSAAALQRAGADRVLPGFADVDAALGALLGSGLAGVRRVDAHD